jgi:endoglucanase
VPDAVLVVTAASRRASRRLAAHPRDGGDPRRPPPRCNPPGRGVGRRPQLAPGVAGVDAFLWVKRSGESDGACNGGPAGGAWWPDQALGLARRAGW